MKKTEITLYSFDELPTNVQKKVIEEYYENETYPFLHEDIREYLHCMDEDKYFINPKIYYSLGYSQGDGLCIDAEIDFVEFIKDKYDIPLYKKNALCEYVYSVRSKNNGRYTFASPNQIEYSLNYYKDLPNIDELVENVLSDIKDMYMNVCSKLEKYGYGIIEYRMSADEFADNVGCYLYYTIDGKIY